MTQKLLDFWPGLDMTWQIRETDTRFETMFWMGATMAEPPLHVHPKAKESYKVLEGSMRVNVDGDWRTLRAGEDVTVPAGVPHTLGPDPDSNEGATLINVHDPALGFESFFREFHRLSSTGIATFPPTNPRSMLHVAMLFNAHREELKSVRPPQRVLDVLAFVGRRVGYEIRT